MSGLIALSSCSFSLSRNCLLTMSSQIEETVVNVEEPVITAPGAPGKQHRKRHTSSTSGKKEKKEKKSEKKEKTEKKEKNKERKEKSDKKEKDENGAKRRRRQSKWQPRIKGQPCILASLATDGIEEAIYINMYSAVLVRYVYYPSGVTYLPNPFIRPCEPQLWTCCGNQVANFGNQVANFGNQVAN